jgi:hypothetical protein
MGGSTLGVPKKQLQKLKINRKTKVPTCVKKQQRCEKKSLGILFYFFG